MLKKALQCSIRLVPWRLRCLIKSVPLVARIQQWALSKFLYGQEFVHTIDAGPAQGLNFPVVLPDDKGVWTGTYELDFVQRIASSVPVDGVCLDVGGWRGYVAGVMACSGASATHIFEPMKSNCERIQRLIELNPDLRLSLNRCAVGEKNGKASFCLMPESSMGKLDTSPFQDEKTTAQKVIIDVVSLDTWSTQNGIEHIDLIKFDVEGAEMMALRGAETLIEQMRPHLFVETHSRQLTSEVTAFLTARHYQVTTLETGQSPDGTTEPEVCHLLGLPQ